MGRAQNRLTVQPCTMLSLRLARWQPAEGDTISRKDVARKSLDSVGFFC